MPWPTLSTSPFGQVVAVLGSILTTAYMTTNRVCGKGAPAVDTTTMRTRAAPVGASGVFGRSNSALPPLPHGGIGCIRAASGASYRASASFPRDFSEKLRRGFRKAHHIPSEARGKSPSSKRTTADCAPSLCPVFVSAAAPSVFVVRGRALSVLAALRGCTSSLSVRARLPRAPCRTPRRDRDVAGRSINPYHQLNSPTPQRPRAPRICAELSLQRTLQRLGPSRPQLHTSSLHV